MCEVVILDRYYRFRGKRRLVDEMERLGFKAEYDMWVQGDTKRDVIVFTRRLSGIEIRIICPAGNRNCYADIVLPVSRRQLSSEIARLLEFLKSGGASS
jgi:hypothetical protein